MSLNQRMLHRVAKLAVLLMTALVFPASPAHAIQVTNWTPLNTTGNGAHNWHVAASNYSGSVLYAAASGGYLYKSTDSGATWTRLESAGKRNWFNIATNDSGTVVVALSNYGKGVISVNSGINWVEIALGEKNWQGVAVSASGNTIYATAGNAGSVWRSTNTGANWTPLTPGPTYIGSISTSGDGTNVALQTGSGVYLSSNSGTNWTPYANLFIGTSSYQNSISMSRDGQRITAIGGNSDYAVRTTQNFGSSWETTSVLAANTPLRVVKLSGDGNRILASFANGKIYSSTFAGISWTAAGLAGYSLSIASNYTGTQLVNTFQNSYANQGIYLSTDSGATWSVRSVADGITKVARMDGSVTGQTVVAVTEYGNVWISKDYGDTWAIAPNIPASANWNCLAVSADGSDIYLGGTLTNLWRSVNGGSSFAAVTTGSIVGTRYFNGCAVSNDGMTVAISFSAVGIQVSTDRGLNFSNSLLNSSPLGSFSFGGVVMNDDGTKIATIASNASAPVFIKRASGSAWETSTATAANAVLKASKSGSVLIASAASTHTPKISRDWGLTWSSLPSTIGVSFMEGISISSDGATIIAGSTSTSGYMFISTDSGAIFSQITSATAGYQRSVFLSPDGNFLFQGAEYAQIMRATLSMYADTFLQKLTFSTSPQFRKQVTISATILTAGADGKITFFANGKKIPGCILRPTSSLVATCVWTPSARGSANLSAIAYPTDVLFRNGSTSVQVAVTNRTGLRG